MVQIRGAFRKRFFDKQARLQREQKELRALTTKRKFAEKEHAIREKIEEEHARINVSKGTGTSKKAKAFAFGLKLGKELLKANKPKRKTKRRTTKRRTTKRRKKKSFSMI